MENEPQKEIPPQVKELNAYIDSLFDQMDVAFEKQKKAMIYQLAALALQIACLFLAPAPIAAIANVLFWSTFLYGTFFIQPRIGEVASEIDGCFKTLEILGFIEKNPFGGRRKRRTLADLFAPLVRSWQTLKEKAQRETYGQGMPSPVAAMIAK